MANLSKIKRDKMIAYLESLKVQHNDDESIKALNEIENQLRSKKYGLVWEEHSEEVDELLKEYIPVLKGDSKRRLCKDETKPWNFIIEGDNLQALYLLKKTHKGRVDCIYIDPPYNSGARDWKYNNDYVDKEDSYKHSKWLSMMKNRLELAKQLLNPKSSVLIVTIDDKEYLHLGCLLEEMFPMAKITMISSVINPAGKAKKGGVDFSRTDEYIFFLQIGDSPVLPETRDISETPIAWESLRRHSLANGRGKHGVGACGPNQFYPFYINVETKEIVEIGEPISDDVPRSSVKQIDGCVAVFPVRDNGIEMNWGCVRETAWELYKKGYLRVGSYFPDKPQQFGINYLTKGTIKAIENGEVIVTSQDSIGILEGYFPVGKPKVPTTNWNKPTHNATSHGTDLINKIFCEQRFDYPKSLYAVEDCLKLFLTYKKDAIIVDFFAGSGTTLHAVNLLNAEDGGNRKCIMVTNNEISAEEEKKLMDAGYKKGDEEWEKLGVAKHVTWPRTVCSINGIDVDGNKLNGEYLIKDKKGENIPLCTGFISNVKYFKCGWIPRNPEDFLLSNALCLHVKELIELQTAQEVDGIKNVIVYNKSDYKRLFEDEENFRKIEKVWVNESIIFNANEIKKLKEKKFKFIPREYFSQELKEVGEYV